MFSNEKQLQEWLADRLRASGYNPQVEVVSHSRHKTRADIVVGDTVIECKKILDRESIHNAYSQAIMYSKMLNLPKRVLVGMPPFSATGQSSARSAAAALLSTDANLSIYWVNQSGIIPLEQSRHSVLDAIDTPVRQPVPVPIYTPAPIPVPAPPVWQPAKSSPMQVPTTAPVSLWRVVGALAYIVIGGYLGGLLGVFCGLFGAFFLIVSR